MKAGAPVYEGGYSEEGDEAKRSRYLFETRLSCKLEPWGPWRMDSEGLAVGLYPPWPSCASN